MHGHFISTKINIRQKLVFILSPILPPNPKKAHTQQNILRKSSSVFYNKVMWPGILKRVSCKQSQDDFSVLNLSVNFEFTKNGKKKGERNKFVFSQLITPQPLQNRL